jgi:hypothetical protein
MCVRIEKVRLKKVLSLPFSRSLADPPQSLAEAPRGPEVMSGRSLVSPVLSLRSLVFSLVLNGLERNQNRGIWNACSRSSKATGARMLFPTLKPASAHFKAKEVWPRPFS